MKIGLGHISDGIKNAKLINIDNRTIIFAVLKSHTTSKVNSKYFWLQSSLEKLLSKKNLLKQFRIFDLKLNFAKNSEKEQRTASANLNNQEFFEFSIDSTDTLKNISELALY